jgi:uncharacterized Zn finger protein
MVFEFLSKAFGKTKNKRINLRCNKCSSNNFILSICRTNKLVTITTRCNDCDKIHKKLLIRDFDNNGNDVSNRW